MATEKPKRTVQRRWIVLVGVLISVIFLFLAFRGLKPEQFINSLSTVNSGWLLLAAVVFFLSMIVIAWRWQFLLETVKHVSLMELTQIVAIGYMGNNVYPLRAGEALRIFILRRNHNIPITSSGTTIVVERVFDGIVMLSFVLLGLLWVGIQNETINWIIRISAIVFGIAVIIFFTLTAFPGILRYVVERVATFLPETLAKLLHKVHDDMLVGLSSLRSPLHLIGAILTSYATWAIQVLIYWMVMWAFHLDLSAGVALLVTGAVNLAGLLPTSPGQVGVYEFTISQVLQAVGVQADTALAYAIVVHIVIWLPVTVVGFLFLIRQGLGWSAVTSASELNP